MLDTNRVGNRAAVILVLGLALAACGGDEVTTSTDAPTATTTTEPTGDIVEVELNDFEFIGLSESVPAGTRLAVVNHAESELHEMVVFKLAEGEQRSASELAGLDPLDLEATLGAPVTVLLAAPAGEQVAAVGDGTLNEPGKYVAFCFIPTGVDPQVYLEAVAQSQDGPPQIEGVGPPHFVHGMLADFDVG